MFFSRSRVVLTAILRDEYLTSAARTRKIALKTARDREKNMTHDSVNIFFKLFLKNLL